MEKYLPIRVQTALYLSIFFISLHHVFVFLVNSSTLRYIFGLKTSEVLSIYGIASLFGICIFLTILRKGITDNIKKNIYVATCIEILCLISMYYFTVYQNAYIFTAIFIVHHSITAYIMFNLDSLFEAYTNIKDRGRSRGVYLTVWNIPFVITPLIMSTLSIGKLPVVYLISSAILFPFLYLIFHHIKNPSPLVLENSEPDHINIFDKLKGFFQDKLDRRAFITQSLLHLYYGSIAIMLPIYLHSTFLFDWNKIGLILAAMTAPFILVQIPFGNMEDKRHNEKGLFKIGLTITAVFSVFVLLVSPTNEANISFLLLSLFLFISHIGCGLIEISTESMFYKHITERDHTALLVFRMARIIPYSLAIFALLWI